MRAHGLHEGCVMFSPAATGVASRMVAAAAMATPYQMSLYSGQAFSSLQLQHATDDYGEARRWFVSIEVATDKRWDDATSCGSVLTR